MSKKMFDLKDPNNKKYDDEVCLSSLYFSSLMLLEFEFYLKRDWISPTYEIFKKYVTTRKKFLFKKLATNNYTS